jgi:hypothetical protein
MSPVNHSSGSNFVDLARTAALRAVLRDNTGQVPVLTKVQAFNSLPRKTPLLDVKA